MRLRPRRRERAVGRVVGAGPRPPDDRAWQGWCLGQAAGAPGPRPTRVPDETPGGRPLPPLFRLEIQHDRRLFPLAPAHGE